MKLALVRGTLAAALGLALVMQPALAADPSLKTEKDKHSYMIGMLWGKQLQDVKGDVDIAIVQKALADSFAGGKMLLTEEEAQQLSMDFRTKIQQRMEAERAKQGESNKTEGEAFLAANKSKPGIKVTESGLQYQVIKQGTGPKPKLNDQVKVHYVGTLIDGTKFDSSVDRGQPATFPLNGVIAGWTEALQLMPVGSKYKLFIPSALAYGEQGQPAGGIAPNAVLIFEVELLEILN